MKTAAYLFVNKQTLFSIWLKNNFMYKQVFAY